jgi:hypothetical protein
VMEEVGVLSFFPLLPFWFQFNNNFVTIIEAP